MLSCKDSPVPVQLTAYSSCRSYVVRPQKQALSSGLVHRTGGCPDAGDGGSSTTSRSTTNSAATEAAGTVDAAIGSSTPEREMIGFADGPGVSCTTSDDQQSRTRQRYHRTDGQATARRHHHHCRRLWGTAGRMRDDDDRLTRTVLSDGIVFIEQTTAEPRARST